MIKKIARLIIRISPRFFTLGLLNLLSKLFFKSKVFFSYNERNGMFVASSSDFQQKINILHKTRLESYLPGIDSRMEGFLERYCLENIQFPSGSVVYDCGANIGELGVHLSHLKRNIEYTGFEPGLAEFVALGINNPNSTSVNKALWSPPVSGYMSAQ
jgi:hypothetical protein